MAILASNVSTLKDFAKKLDPNGKAAAIAELLSQTNEILDDMLFMEGNLPTGHRTTIRTGLPTVYWRLINKGVPPSKSTTAQVDEGIGMLEAYSVVDVELANLNGNTSAFRLGEATAFLEAMNQEMASTIFYGNSSLSPEEFNGLSVRYSDSSVANGQNIIKAGGSGSDNSSIWLVCWGQATCHGIFPKGSKAGLEHKDLGEQTVEDGSGIAGSILQAYRDNWKWKAGIALKDWRYVVRICNIDISALIAGSGADLPTLMIKALHRLPNMNMGKPVFYMNRTVFEYLDIQRRDDVQAGGQLDYQVVDGKAIYAFRGIPIKKCDALLETEATVA
jgi:hypothetical protein